MNFLKDPAKGRRPVLAAVLFLAAAVLSPPLEAQQYLSFSSEIENMNQTAKLKIGPFLVYPRLGLGYGYDNNIYGKTAAQGTVLGRWAYISLPVTVYLPLKDWLIFDVSTSPSYDYYFDLKRERSPNFSIFPRLKALLFGRIVATGTLRRSRSRYRLSSEFDQRVWLETSGYSIDLFYDTPRQTSLGFNGYLTRFKYESVILQGATAPLSSSLNREEGGGKLEFYYRLAPGTFFFANLGATSYKFDRLGIFRDSRSYQAYSGIRFPLLGKATGTISLGYKKLIPKQSQYRGYSGIVGDTGLDLRIERFVFRLGFARDIPFSYAEKVIYLIDTNAGAGISFYLSQRVRLDYDYRVGRIQYPAETQAPAGAAPLEVASTRIETIRDHSFGLLYRVFGTAGIGLRATYYERESLLLGGTIRRFFFNANLTYQF